jgi:hypothetical protein
MKTLSIISASLLIVFWVLGIIKPINLFATIFLVLVIIMGFMPFFSRNTRLQNRPL